MVKPILSSSAEVSEVITCFRKHIAFLPCCESSSFPWRFSHTDKSTLDGIIKRGRNNFQDWDMGAHSFPVHVVFSSPQRCRQRTIRAGGGSALQHLWGGLSLKKDSGVSHSNASLVTPVLCLSVLSPAVLGSAWQCRVSALVLVLDCVC